MLILGVDEAGRGPVIGSMFIAGVLVDSKDEPSLKAAGVKDSKQVPQKKRAVLEKLIKSMAKEIHFIEVTAMEIDSKRRFMSLNELEALKISQLIEFFRAKPDRVVVDAPDPIAGEFLKRIRRYTKIDAEIVCEHKADVNHPSCSAASIIAKRERDKHTRAIEKKFGVRVGNGYAHDPEAIKFLEKCMHGKGYPEFVRQSWETAARVREQKTQKKLAEF
ncbi:ribonuclease HII [Candidatus Micrarchaeota archaeon]|nr:ribonuclease HII [Candidatus Micrarchaeota archaeon]